MTKCPTIVLEEDTNAGVAVVEAFIKRFVIDCCHTLQSGWQLKVLTFEKHHPRLAIQGLFPLGGLNVLAHISELLR